MLQASEPPQRALPGEQKAVHIGKAQMFSRPSLGFTPPPYVLGADMPGGAWKAVDLPYAESPQVQIQPPQDPPLTTEFWYRLAVPALAQEASPLYLYLPRWKSDGQVAIYGDGRLLYQSDAKFLWNAVNLPLWIPLQGTAGAPAVREVQIRGQRLRHTGAALSTAWVGSSAAIGWRYQVRYWLQSDFPAMSSAAFLAAGVFALGVWLWRRREALYLLFFVMSAVAFVRTLHYFVSRQRLPISDEWFGWITVSSLFWLVLTAHFFLRYMHGVRHRWLTITACTITAAVSAVTLPIVPALPNAALLSPLLYVVLLVLGTTLFAMACLDAWRVRSKEAGLLAGWGLISLLAGGYDWLLQSNLLVNVEGMYLGAYSNIGVFFIFSYVVLHRYLAAIDGMERVNTHLEQRLREREGELAQSYARLRDVEHRETLVQERQRLMQDMHDGLGSSLTSALHLVRHGKAGSEELAQVLAECMDDLKLAIDSMEPVDADLLLLLATLRFRLAPRLEGLGMALRWEVQDVPLVPWLDAASALHLLRILQECFANIVKHAQASCIRVECEEAQDGGIEVRVLDDGRGFDVDAALKARGRGLKNQLRRAEAIGARLSWASSAATGTRCVLWLPLESAVVPAPGPKAAP
ncbi:signal transduction histidine kinase [Acidovorax sp. CF316]|nr:signal transduction histidine kinase [Acidovorax sp. CF316]